MWTQNICSVFMCGRKFRSQSCVFKFIRHSVDEALVSQKVIPPILFCNTFGTTKIFRICSTIDTWLWHMKGLASSPGILLYPSRRVDWGRGYGRTTRGPLLLTPETHGETGSVHPKRSQKATLKCLFFCFMC